MLKIKVLGLAALNKIKVRQRSRLTWIKEGDANAKLFHLKANARRRKNFIHCLQTSSGSATTHAEKEQELHSFFSNRLGVCQQRECTINWENLHLPSFDLQDQEEEISFQELKQAIFSIPSEKAPGPDGFIGIFYKTCWNIIKDDLFKAVKAFFDLNTTQLEELNSAFIVLLPKHEQATSADKFRPISLIHSFAKIVTKILANRLASRLSEMVSQNQSAFIRK